MGKFRLFAVLLLALCTTAVYGQKSISGTLTDDVSGEALIGVNILVVGTTVGTVSDIDGNYTLNVPEGSTTVQFSYVGYTSREVDVSEGTIFNVLMGTSEILDEVIVIGYGTMKKSDKTGAVVAVTAEELNQGRLSDPIQGLQGKAAGVLITKQGGDPNAGFSVNIRGASSFTAGTGPLYVVDGVAGVDPTTISPDDIESFNVLKDASSAAIYGARGGNGVIIITTKGANLSGNGKELNRVEYNGYVSFDQVANSPDLLNGSEIRAFAERTGRTFIDNGANVDWQDEIYRTAISHNHTLAFSGQDDNTVYRASISANFINGVLEGTDKTRYIGRLNLTQKAIKDRLTLNARISATFEKNNYVSYGNGSSPNNVIYQAIRRSPTDPVYAEDGTFFETDRSFQYYNPMALINDVQNERNAKRLLANLKATGDIYKGLSASVNFAYIRNDEEKFYFEPTFATFNETNGLGRRNYSNEEGILFEATLNYVNTIKERHSINAVFGRTWEKTTFDGFSAEGKDAQSDYVESNNLEFLLELEPGSIKSYKNEELAGSFITRFIYDLDKKYYITGTLRYDGSSKFGDNNEWGWFPSGSVGWNIKEEAFMDNLSNLSRLKLRLGYGVTGNSDIPNGIDVLKYGSKGPGFNENGDEVLDIGVDADNEGNPDLKWERISELNIGVDFGIFRDRLSGSIEYYRKRTDDLIFNIRQPVPPNSEEFKYVNAGQVDNNGLEVTLQAFLISKPNYKWKTTITLAHNKQKTVSLANAEDNELGIKKLYVSGRGLVGGENWTQIIKPGLAIGTFFMPEYVALSEDGQFLFATAAGGVTRDPTLAERRVVGQAQPKFVGGWSNYFDLPKGVDITFAFRTMVGHDVLNVTRMVFSNPTELPSLNTLTEAVDEYDRGLTDNPTVSSYYLEPASFLKLDYAAIGYTIEKLSAKNIGTIRLYLSGSNLFTLTKYSGTDPEVSYGGTEFGRDQYDVYPKTRSITIGVNATF